MHLIPPHPPLPPSLPQGRVVSGHMSALTLVSEAATAGGALKAAMLAVAGAFHTDLMRPASQALTQAGGRRGGGSGEEEIGGGEGRGGRILSTPSMDQTF